MERAKENREPLPAWSVSSLAACTPLIAFSAAAVLTAGWRPAVAADAVPLAAFGHLPTLEDVAISPDGTKIAFVRTSGESRKLVVIPLNKSETIGAVLNKAISC